MGINAQINNHLEKRYKLLCPINHSPCVSIFKVSHDERPETPLPDPQLERLPNSMSHGTRRCIKAAQRTAIGDLFEERES